MTEMLLRPTHLVQAPTTEGNTGGHIKRQRREEEQEERHGGRHSSRELRAIEGMF